MAPIEPSWFTWESSVRPRMPRRFSIGAALLAMALHAVFLGLLRWAGATTGQLIVAATFCLFSTGVVLAQMLLFRGKGLRKAAVCAGIVMGPMIWAALFAYRQWLDRGLVDQRVSTDTLDILLGAASAAIFGGIGGMFLGMFVEVAVWCRAFVRLGRDLDKLRDDVVRDARARANDEVDANSSYTQHGARDEGESETPEGEPADEPGNGRV